MLTIDDWFAAVVKGRKGPSNGSVYTEEDWNDESSLTESPYMYSKVRQTTIAPTRHNATWQPEWLRVLSQRHCDGLLD